MWYLLGLALALYALIWWLNKRDKKEELHFAEYEKVELSDESILKQQSGFEEHSENSIGLPAPSKTEHSIESHQEAMARLKATIDAIAERMGNPVIEPPTPDEIEKLHAEFSHHNRARRWLHNDE